MSTTTTTETGWALQHMSNAAIYRHPYAAEGGVDHARIFPDKASALKWSIGQNWWKSVPVTRTITVEIGEPEP
jgi:hypothetical protein